MPRKTKPWSLKIKSLIGLGIGSIVYYIVGKNSNELPAECSNLTLVKGDPLTAKTILLGNNHRDPSCKSSFVRCIKKLSNGTTPQERIILVESAASGTYIDCNENPKIAWGSITHTCQGWNRPLNESAHIRMKLDGHKHQMAVLDMFRETGKLTVKKGTQQLIETCKREISDAQKKIQSAESRHKNTFNKFKKTHPEVTIDQFHSDALMDKEEFILKKSYYESILGQITSGVSATDIIMNFIKKHRLDSTTDNLFNSLEDELILPNQSLFSSINKTKTKHKKIYALAGSRHVDKTFSRTKAEAEAVQSLYNDLDKFADDNPYAVLNCGF